MGQGPPIVSLPADVLTEVLGRVASSSFTDLFNAKLCCRDFLGAAEEDYILEHISIDKFPVIPWFTRDEEICFLNRCKEKGNPEALYRQGMIEYFNSRNMDLGLEYLKRATDKGHVEASYAYGVILVSRGGESAQNGLKVLNSLKSGSGTKSRSSRIKECRRRTKEVIRTMWINNYVVRQLNTGMCCHQKSEGTCTRINGRSWTNYDDEEDHEVMACDACRWDQEVVSFCKMLRGENRI
ncbi:hypothetical protein LguiB_024664 [Lonicera macranthoides]